MSQAPSLRQSLYEQMACEHSYKLVHIDGLRSPETPESARGTDVHAIMAPYAEHCAMKRVPSDYAFMDSLCDAIGPEAAAILENCRDSISIDWQNFFGAEIYFGLDRDMQPTFSYDHDNVRVPINSTWGIDGSDNEPDFTGIIDVLYVLPGETVARVPDYKTHPRPFKPTTFQAKLYSLAVFMHLPKLQELEFGLHFLRYPNVIEPIKYYRSDVPRLMDEVRRERNRQIDIDRRARAGETLRVHAGAHCQYCPAISNFTCPIAKLNPHTNLSPAQRLQFRLWYDVASRINKKAMDQYVDGTGEAIETKDANGKSYTYGPVTKEKVTFPLFKARPDGGFDMPVIDQILKWGETNPADLIPRKGNNPWVCNLKIGSTEMNRYLKKVAKRELLHNAVRDVSDVTTKIELRITRDAEVDDGQGEEHREWDPSGDEEIEF